MCRASNRIALLLLFLLTFPCAGVEPSVSKKRALQLATQDAGGFLGTWVEATLLQSIWCVTARSKSVRPPALYLIDAHDGRILYKASNSDAASLEGKAVEGPSGAVIVLSGGINVQVVGLDTWPAFQRDRSIRARGCLTLRNEGLRLQDCTFLR